MFERDDFSELVMNIPGEIEQEIVEAFAEALGWERSLEIVGGCIRKAINEGLVEDQISVEAEMSKYSRKGRHTSKENVDRLLYYEALPVNLTVLSEWIGFCLQIGLREEAYASAIIAADTLENLDEEDAQLISFNEKLAGQIRMYVDQEDLWSLVYDGLTGTDAVG